MANKIYKVYYKKLSELSENLNKFQKKILEKSSKNETIDEDEIKIFKMVSHFYDVFVAVENNGDVSISDIQAAYHKVKQTVDTNSDVANTDDPDSDNITIDGISITIPKNKNQESTFGSGFDHNSDKNERNNTTDKPTIIKEEPDYNDPFEKEKSLAYATAINNTLRELGQIRERQYYSINHCVDYISESDSESDSGSGSDSDSDSESDFKSGAESEVEDETEGIRPDASDNHASTLPSNTKCEPKCAPIAEGIKTESEPGTRSVSEDEIKRIMSSDSHKQYFEAYSDM
jgi:hypothetical protein